MADLKAIPGGRQTLTRGNWNPSDESGAPEMFPGLVGRLVEISEAHTEAAAAAIAAQFVVLFGNAVGHGPYFSVGETRHHLNENLLVVGASAVSRKGDGYQVARAPFKIGEPEWEKFRVKGGLSTGEGLIHHVRDRRSGLNKNGVEEIVDEGVADKRLMVVESEFANMLKVAAREGNTLTGVCRLAWDGNEVLSNLSKGAAEQASEAHVSVIGHSTPEDLTQYLSATDVANGFGNRFLILATRRARSIPNPAGIPGKQLSELGRELRGLLERGRVVKEMQRSPEAAELWNGLYEELTTPPPGLLGTLLARGAPHVTRLSAIYALLDGSPGQIEVEHVASALAFWEVVAESTRHIFGDRTGNFTADRIREHMAPDEELTLSQIRERLFANKIPGERLRAAIDLLEQLGEFAMCMEREKRETKGRPREVLRRLTPVEVRRNRRANGVDQVGGLHTPFSTFSTFSSHPVDS